MDDSTLVIQGKKYTRTNVHQLPEKISGFNCTSKVMMKLYVSSEN